MPAEDKIKIKEYLRIPGLLMSLIKGDVFPALSLKESAPPKDWKKGLQAAADVVNEWGILGVYNDDTSPENIMLRKVITEAKIEYKAIAFNFAPARVRRKRETNQEWKEHKFKRDEEGAVLAVMCGSRGLGLDENYSWTTEDMGGTAKHYVPEDDMVYYWGGGCTGSVFI